MPPTEAAVEDLILRIRWERATKHHFEPGSPGWSIVDGRERELVAALHERFGHENVTGRSLEWFITRSFGAAPPTPAERN
jgi:hypothetical protein